MLVLALRETFRYRLLLTRVAWLSTGAALGVVFAWFGVALWAVIADGVLAGLLTMATSFTFGAAARGSLRLLQDTGPFGPEEQARRAFEAGLDHGEGVTPMGSDPMDEVIARHRLSQADFGLVADALRRQGLADAEIARAVARPEVIDWYFERIGRDGRFTLDTSLELINLARG